MGAGSVLIPFGEAPFMQCSCLMGVDKCGWSFPLPHPLANGQRFCWICLDVSIFSGRLDLTGLVSHSSFWCTPKCVVNSVWQLLCNSMHPSYTQLVKKCSDANTLIVPATQRLKPTKQQSTCWVCIDRGFFSFPCQKSKYLELHWQVKDYRDLCCLWMF